MLLDKDIREPLFDYLEQLYGKIRILEEKRIGRSRADICMVLPDAVCGIEIKSDADTYARLARQIEDYDRYYDWNMIVVGSSHGIHVCEHIPEYWGVITVEEVDEKIDFYFYRKPKRNPKMQWRSKLSLLWRPELAQLQVWNRMPKYKEKSKDFVCRKIEEKIPEQIAEKALQNQISELLFERDYTKVSEMLASYRKGEIQKELEKVTDPCKQIELMMQQSVKREEFAKRKYGRKKHRRRF